jgi:hypothetical protein
MTDDKDPTDLGMNRTGLATAPRHATAMVASSHDDIAATVADGAAIAGVRATYVVAAEAIGSVPPPTTIKGMAKTAMQMLKGQKPTVLLDKLGERLAFERAGTRLYELLLTKFDALGPTWDGGPTRERLEHFGREEHEHVALVRRAIEKLGGDPTVQTPSADLTGVEGLGIVQVISDPRTTLGQSLHAMLIAELADNDAWSLLIELVEAAGQDELATEFRAAERAEAEHLSAVRQWLANEGRAALKGGETASPART